VPFEAKSNLVEVRYLGLSVLAITQTVAPGIFVLSDGTPAIEHGEALSLVTPANPAAAGEVIIIYVTGLGLVNPPVATGAATGTAAAIQPECIPPLVNAGEILYEGLTPGFVGLYQMRVRGIAIASLRQCGPLYSICRLLAGWTALG